MLLYNVKKIKYALLLSLALVSTSTQPISQGRADLCSTALGLAIYLTACGIAVHGPEVNPVIRVMTVIFSSGALGFAAANRLFHPYTPRGKVERAERLLGEVASHDLICREHDNIKKITNLVEDIYIFGSSRPLVAAITRLHLQSAKLRECLSLANEAAEEKDFFLDRRISSIIKRTNALQVIIDKMTAMIESSQEFRDQATTPYAMKIANFIHKDPDLS